MNADVAERRTPKGAGTGGGRGARQRIVAAAMKLFYHEGINATGVERLATEASVSKRTLYQHFPSKDAVVEEYLRFIQQHVGDPLRPGPDDLRRTPRARILALFETPSPDGQMRGCPFHNAAVEAAEAMPEIHEIVKEHKRNYIDGVARLAKEAGAGNPKLLANQLAVLYEGAAALSTSLDDPAPWTHARKAAQTLIDLAVASQR
ncbi:TetR/AcrR family transcriptional regulator [Mycolicibacterium vinylchloridicum]|uniref:TetR/AcrR family transcriptional regulator n=1 Tax=Mycolicibacterium vinylchloridicum TaxID=2736928 RepID=UPI0015C7467E|nr:TetR/AcrR family transcriptional regulator [Mycolicibacterium vinylchloridicum]